MKTRAHVKLLISAILSMWLISGCADQATKSDSGSMASPEATAAIASASSAIKAAKANKWIWRDTEKFAKQAQEAANKGDNATAIKLANKAKFQAESAVTQYKFEKANPRGL
jgi:N-acetylglucosamine kinase-like BadF-type ATPase